LCSKHGTCKLHRASFQSDCQYDIFSIGDCSSRTSVQPVRVEQCSAHGRRRAYLAAEVDTSICISCDRHAAPCRSGDFDNVPHRRSRCRSSACAASRRLYGRYLPAPVSSPVVVVYARTVVDSRRSSSGSARSAATQRHCNQFSSRNARRS